MELRILFLLPSLAVATQHHLYWNSSNPIFASGAVGLRVEPMDRVIFHCPSYADSVEAAAAETSILYLVPAWGFASCELGGAARAVGQCLSPFSPLRLAIVIRAFTPLPSAPEFRAGESYFFVSTSTGAKEGLRNRRGGLCAENNLRLRLDVREPTPKPTPKPKMPVRVLHSAPTTPDFPETSTTPAAVDPTPDLEEFLQKLRKPKRTRGSWWNPSSAPDYVPLPASNSVLDSYEISQPPADADTIRGGPYWADLQKDEAAEILFEIEEGSWAASHRGFHNSAGKLLLRPFFIISSCLVCAFFTLR